LFCCLARLVLLVAGQRLRHRVCNYAHRGLRLYINGEQEDFIDFGAIQSG
jgi:hypothetical protein